MPAQVGSDSSRRAPLARARGGLPSVHLGFTIRSMCRSASVLRWPSLHSGLAVPHRLVHHLSFLSCSISNSVLRRPWHELALNCRMRRAGPDREAAVSARWRRRSAARWCAGSRGSGSRRRGLDFAKASSRMLPRASSAHARGVAEAPPPQLEQRSRCLVYGAAESDSLTSAAVPIVAAQAFVSVDFPTPDEPRNSTVWRRRNAAAHRRPRALDLMTWIGAQATASTSATIAARSCARSALVQDDAAARRFRRRRQ